MNVVDLSTHTRCGWGLADGWSCRLPGGHKGDHMMEAPINVVELLADALKAICTTNDSGVWIDVYRQTGGGYEGLQAIAAAALDATADERGDPNRYRVPSKEARLSR